MKWVVLGWQRRSWPLCSAGTFLAQLAAGPDRPANLVRVLDVMGEAKRAGAGLIAFPEFILDRFFPESRDTARP